MTRRRYPLIILINLTATHHIATTCIPRHVEPISFVLWTMFWFISTIKISIDSRDGTLTAYYLQIATFLCNAALWMEWNSHKFVADARADGPGTGRSVKCRVYRGLKWLSSGRSGSGKISSRYFAIETKK